MKVLRTKRVRVGPSSVHDPFFKKSTPWGRRTRGIRGHNDATLEQTDRSGLGVAASVSSTADGGHETRTIPLVQSGGQPFEGSEAPSLGSS